MTKVTAFRKLASTVVCLQLITGIMPVRVFAEQRQDHLRPKAFRDGGADNFNALAADLGAVSAADETVFSGRAQRDGGAKVPVIPFLKDFGKKEFEGVRVLLSLDLNMSDDSGNIKSLQRLEEAMPTILYYLDMGATPVIISHNNKPGGKVVDAYKMGPIAQKMQELIAASGRSFRVNMLEDSITEKGLKPGLNAEIEDGAVNVLDDSRFFRGEERNDVAFSKELAAVVDYDQFGSDAFAAYERVHASRAGAAQYIESVVEGPLMKKEYRYLLEVVDVLDGMVIGGGPKLEEKMRIVSNVAGTMKPGSFIAWGSAPMGAFLKVLYNLDVGVDPQKLDAKQAASREENLKNARETIAIAKEKGIEMLYPVDYVAINMDPGAQVERDGKKGKETKSWIEWKMVPEGAQIMQVKVSDGRLLDKKTGAVLDASSLYLVDIGEDTQKLFAERIMRMEKGRAVFHNGTVGIFEIPLFGAGGKAVDEAMARATKEKGVITVIGGGDTGKEAEKNKVSKLITHCSTGGGASAALLQGETLKVANALSKLQNNIDGMLRTLGADQPAFMRFIAANKKAFTVAGGQEFRKFVNRVKSTGARHYYLNDVLFSAGIAPSGNAMVVLRLGEFDSGAEAAAGAAADEIEKGVNDIAALLKSSYLDLGKYDDMKQAIKVVRDEANKRLKDGKADKLISEKAVNAFSAALWRLAAKVNDKGVGEYIRWNESGFVLNGASAEEGAALGIAEADIRQAAGEIGARLQGSALLVESGFFKTPGAVTALNIASQLEKELKIVVYGEKADSLKSLLKNDNVFAARDAAEAVDWLRKVGLVASKIVQIQSSPSVDTSADAYLADNNVRQIIVNGQPATVVVAKALKEATGTPGSNDDFGTFYASLKDTGVISADVYEQTKAEMTEALTAQTMQLPAMAMEASLSETKNLEYNEAKTAIAEFIDKV